MNIEMNNDLIQKAIQDSADEAIKSALGSYDVKVAIGKAVTAEVATGAIQKAISQGIKAVDTAQLTQHLAEQLARTVTAGTACLIESGMVELILKLQGIESYHDGYKRAKEELRQRLKEETK